MPSFQSDAMQLFLRLRNWKLFEINRKKGTFYVVIYAKRILLFSIIHTFFYKTQTLRFKENTLYILSSTFYDCLDDNNTNYKFLLGSFPKPLNLVVFCRKRNNHTTSLILSHKSVNNIIIH